jgi:hypothetical protein
VYHAAPLIVAQIAVCLRLRQPAVVGRTGATSRSASAVPDHLQHHAVLAGSMTSGSYWQFVMVALGFLAKEFLRWKRDGINTHIFKPVVVSTWRSCPVLPAAERARAT